MKEKLEELLRQANAMRATITQMLAELAASTVSVPEPIDTDTRPVDEVLTEVAATMVETILNRASATVGGRQNVQEEVSSYASGTMDKLIATATYAEAFNLLAREITRAEANTTWVDVFTPIIVTALQEAQATIKQHIG